MIKDYFEFPYGLVSFGSSNLVVHKFASKKILTCQYMFSFAWWDHRSYSVSCSLDEGINLVRPAVLSVKLLFSIISYQMLQFLPLHY